jgi:hypothetical protein
MELSRERVLAWWMGRPLLGRPGGTTTAGVMLTATTCTTAS